jgi:hypothetical protein
MASNRIYSLREYLFGQRKHEPQPERFNAQEEHEAREDFRARGWAFEYSLRQQSLLFERGWGAGLSGRSDGEHEPWGNNVWSENE